MTGTAVRHLTAAAIADRYGVTPDTVREWHKRGLIPAKRACQRPILFDPDEVERALAAGATERQKGSTKQPGQAAT